jgi:dihydrofolate reductase
MKLAIIAAMTDARVIGRDQALPWHLSEDLKRFKRLTLGHPVLMGRKTWASLPKKPLPERPNVVLSRTEGYEAPGAIHCRTLKQAVGELAPSHQEAFVIGGAALFAEALPFAEKLYLTLIHHPFEGDVYFPDFDRNAFQEIERHRASSEFGWDYEFLDLIRR